MGHPVQGEALAAVEVAHLGTAPSLLRAHAHGQQAQDHGHRDQIHPRSCEWEEALKKSGDREKVSKAPGVFKSTFLRKRKAGSNRMEMNRRVSAPHARPGSASLGVNQSSSSGGGGGQPAFRGLSQSGGFAYLLLMPCQS